MSARDKTSCCGYLRPRRPPRGAHRGSAKVHRVEQNGAVGRTYCEAVVVGSVGRCANLSTTGGAQQFVHGPARRRSARPLRRNHGGSRTSRPAPTAPRALQRPEALLVQQHERRIGRGLASLVSRWAHGVGCRRGCTGDAKCAELDRPRGAEGSLRHQASPPASSPPWDANGGRRPEVGRAVRTSATSSRSSSRSTTTPIVSPTSLCSRGRRPSMVTSNQSSKSSPRQAQEKDLLD
jgi:hypothetical protein